MSKLGQFELNSIVTGDCLEVLRGVPDGVFQTCVTSSPYWGLRDYGIEPQVWGGDADGSWRLAHLGCEHEWGESLEGPVTTQYDDDGRQKIDPNNWSKGVARRKYAKPQHGSFCLRCNAWRGSLGLEPTPELYVEHMVEMFREVRRTLRDDGTLWLNLGDTYGTGTTAARQEGTLDFGKGTNKARQINRAGGMAKQLIGIPWRVALALQADGWWLRSDIIWHKPNCMPESVRDRPTKSHEYLFLLSKSKSYFYDQDAIREPIAEATIERSRYTWKIYGNKDSGLRGDEGGRNDFGRDNQGRDYSAGRNRRTVWTIPTKPFKEAHFATFPPKLIEPCIKAGTSAKGACPECGKGWVRVVKVSGGTIGQSWHDHKHDNEQGMRQKRGDIPTGTFAGEGWKTYERATLGWQPACDCNGDPEQVAWDVKMGLLEYEPIPQLVLDPFMGAGTTAVVALQLARDYFGIEINPEYCEMARQRIAKTQPPLFVC